MKLAMALCLLAMARACLGQVAPEVASPVLDAAARSAIVERALSDLRRDYVLPESIDNMETVVRRQLAEGRYDALTEPRAFAARLTADLRVASRDRHLLVIYQPPPAPVANPQVPPLDPSLLNYGFERVERLPGNIGYIDLRSFDPPARAAKTCAAAMDFVGNTEGLIIDLRNNTGGAPQMVALFASYFFDQRTHLSDIYNRPSNQTRQIWTEEQVAGQRYGQDKDVYVLVGRSTFSAAEDFAYSLQARKRVIVVGEVTGGGAHPVVGRFIGNGFIFMVPASRSINPVTKTNWEGAGVQPDVAVPAFEALHAAHALLLEQVAARNKYPQRAEILDRHLQANAAALLELRALHARESSVPVQFRRGGTQQLQASTSGKVVLEFLRVLNTGNVGAMRRFRERHSMNVAQVIDDYALYHQTGGFRVERIIEITANEVSLIAQHGKDAGRSKLTFTLDETGPQPLQLEVRPWAVSKSSRQ